MENCDNNLDLLLDVWQTPPLARDLAEPILARARAEDDALDGLLQLAAAPPTLGRDLTAGILARARREEFELDRVLDSATVPTMTQDVARPVMRGIRRRRLVGRVVALAGAVASAAAIAIVAMVLPSMMRPSNTANTPPDQPNPAVSVNQRLAALPAEDRQVVENLDLVKDYRVLMYWDTIRAMEQLEQEAPADRL